MTKTQQTGHSFNGAAERKIRNLKQALGSLNMTNTDMDPISFNNLILHLEQEVNSIPIGKRAQGKAMQETTVPNYSTTNTKMPAVNRSQKESKKLHYHRKASPLLPRKDKC